MTNAPGSILQLFFAQEPSLSACVPSCLPRSCAGAWQALAAGASGVTHPHVATIRMEAAARFVATMESRSVRTTLIVTIRRLQHRLHRPQRRPLRHRLRHQALQCLPQRQCPHRHQLRAALEVWSFWAIWRIGALPSNGGMRTCRATASWAASRMTSC